MYNPTFDNLINYMVQQAQSTAERYAIPVQMNGVIIGEFRVDGNYMNNMVSSIQAAGR